MVAEGRESMTVELSFQGRAVSKFIHQILPVRYLPEPGRDDVVTEPDVGNATGPISCSLQQRTRELEFNSVFGKERE